MKSRADHFKRPWTMYVDPKKSSNIGLSIVNGYPESNFVRSSDKNKQQLACLAGSS